MEKGDGERVLYYLIDWKCDYASQCDPSWEPESNVGQGSKAEYHDKLSKDKADGIANDNVRPAAAYNAFNEDH